jgi:hypothetical protein
MGCCEELLDDPEAESTGRLHIQKSVRRQAADRNADAFN